MPMSMPSYALEQSLSLESAIHLDREAAQRTDAGAKTA